MNQDQFNELTEKLLTACKDALGMKAGEYAREGDRLHNFYAAARKRNQHPLDSLLGMQVKHRVSIDDICEDIVKKGKFPTDEMMLEKFKDDTNYNLLAFALIHELREKARKEVFAAACPLPEGAVVHKEFFLNPVAQRFIDEAKRFAENHKVCMRPSGVIDNFVAATHKNADKIMSHCGHKYIPVEEEKLDSCSGCFFQSFGSGDVFCGSEECESGLIWKWIN